MMMCAKLLRGNLFPSRALFCARFSWNYTSVDVKTHKNTNNTQLLYVITNRGYKINRKSTKKHFFQLFNVFSSFNSI